MLTPKFGRMYKSLNLKWSYLVFFRVILGCISVVIDFDVLYIVRVFMVYAPFMEKLAC